MVLQYYPSLSAEPSRASFFGILFGDRNDRTPIPVTNFPVHSRNQPHCLGSHWPSPKNALDLCNL